MEKEVYTKLKEISNGINEIGFNMSVTFVMDYGYQKVKKWTDDEIEEAKVPGLFEPNFYRQILKTAREITLNSEPLDLLMFCMTDTCLDTKYFSNKLCYKDLEKMIKHRIDYEEYGFNRNEEIDYLCGRYGCDAEYFEMLGHKIPNEYWESEE